MELRVDFSIQYQIFGRVGRTYYDAFEIIANRFIEEFNENNYIQQAVANRRDRLWDKLAEINERLSDVRTETESQKPQKSTPNSTPN